ncbi:MAG: sensor histidine kinase, partial [Gemmatimonadota bacterium]
HELKSPIHVIRGYTELLEDELADGMTEAQEGIIEAIVEQTDAMTRLASRLLDIGRLEAGVYRMELETVHVHDLLSALIRSFDVLARERGIRLRPVVEESAPATIHVDPDMIRSEVLGNLVSNALRFTPSGGEVRVRVWQESDEVVFEVSDTGPGIPREQQPFIFEKYYEGGRTRSVGAGLGLAVAKEVVEAHGGRIKLDPDVAEGATFRFHLPATGPAGEG